MEAKHVKDLREAYASVYTQPNQFMSEESVEMGQDPSKSSNPKDRAKRQLEIRRSTAPKGTGVPPQSQGYQSLKDSVDLFDIIKGHLLDEGYADTEEAALAIMANMSEEWRQSILEEPMNPAELEAIAQQAAGEATKRKKKKPPARLSSGMRE